MRENLRRNYNTTTYATSMRPALAQLTPVCYPRLEEEFHLRLERERQRRENAEAEALRRAARLEERRKALELAREAAETAVMIAEDARSAIAVRFNPPA